MPLTILYSLLTILGIGLVIFVHELGHFLAARAVGIRVEAFSIGFGPRLLGFRRGNTDYKVCLIPLGGYVKMAGEDPTRPSTGKPDEFGSKKVWQRILVISAGVIMNVVFARVALPIAFSVGIPFDTPVVGGVAPGGPAWLAGVRRGDRVLAVDGRKILTFEDIQLDVAVADGPVVLTLERDGARLETKVTPLSQEDLGFQRIGISQTIDTIRISEDAFDVSSDDELAARVATGLVAAGLSPDDAIVGLNGIPADQALLRWPYELETTEGPVTLLVRGDSDGGLREVRVPRILGPGPTDRSVIGIRAWDARVAALIPDGAAERFGLREGDLLLEVNGQPLGSTDAFLRAVGAGLDPTRTAVANGFPTPPSWPPVMSILVRREGGTETELTGSLPTRAERAAFAESFALGASGTRITVMAGLPAATAGLQSGDRVLAIGETAVSDPRQLMDAIRGAGEEVSLRIERGDGTFDITVLKAPEQVVASLPFTYKKAVEQVKIPFPESISVGFLYAGRMINRVVETLRSIIGGRVSAKNLGGPITIFRASMHYSKIGLMRGLLFLAVISINLAILNILPIPVLDGGWLMFLIIEKIKGSPVSERTLGYMQWSGLVLILGLMVFVLWQDIVRLVA